MKRWKRCLLTGLAAASLLVSAVSAAESHVRREVKLADGLSLSGSYLQIGTDTVREQVLTYNSGGDAQPMVVYGDTLYGRSTMDYIQNYLAQKNLTAVAGINAAFFDFSTGIPYGMLVSDGVLRSSGDGYAVGILADGTLQIGKPELQVKLSWEGGETILNYNKALSKTNGFCLYSDDYDWVTRDSLSAYSLGLRADHTELSLHDTVTATVISSMPDSKNVEIPHDGFILSLAMDTAYPSAMEQMKQLEKLGADDPLTITVSVSEEWDDVVYSVGGGDLLVEDGRTLSSFKLDSADKAAARTALGIKSNGDVVCYAADKGDRSSGLTLSQLAKRMQELGCVTAINLDGGGSTTVGVTLPGLTDFTTVNDPADGSQRPCANFLFFVRPTVSAGQAVRLHVYPYDAAVLRGGQVELTAAASDRNYMPSFVPSDLSWSATGGEISGNTFTAQKVGTATVTASAGGLTGMATVQVVETPTAMTVRRQDQNTPLETLIVESGETVDLTVDAEYLGIPLSAEDYAFSWYVPAELGRIGEDGMFTASENNLKGDLMVTCGDLRVMVPVEIKANPFADTRGHWARSYITELYYQGIVQGSGDAEGKMYYRPDDSMTRQEFVVAMMRAQKLDLTAYGQVELPFADTAGIAPWAMDAMKAAYALGYFTGSGRGGELYAEPTDTITREAAMTILARTIPVQSASGALESFPDAADVSAWAKPALTAMVEKEIINGIGGRLQPQGNVTRAQVAKMLHAMQ